MNKFKLPLVTVLMTSFNREKFIGEAIESVLKSTYENFEFIIVDDCSTDNTVDIIKEYSKVDQRIKVFINKKNIGDYANRNYAATFAKGRYIKYLDSDDKIYNWGLKYCVEMMEKNPTAGMGIFKAQNKVEEEYFVPETAVQNHFFKSPFLNVGPSGTILRRDCFENVGYFKADYGPASDLYFNLKMASLFPVLVLKNEFFFYRIHEGQEINNLDSYLINNYRYVRDILDFPKLPLSEKLKTQLMVKAKNDFLFCCIRKIIMEGKFKSPITALRDSGLTIKDMISGILNLTI